MSRRLVLELRHHRRAQALARSVLYYDGHKLVGPAFHINELGKLWLDELADVELIVVDPVVAVAIQELGARIMNVGEENESLLYAG